MSRKTIVVVGAGLAGLSAAETLRAEGFDGQVVLIGDEAHAPYTKPPLSKQVLRGEMTIEETAFRPTAWFAEKGIELRLGVRAAAIDPHAHRVTLADGDVQPYDALLLATGGRARTLDVAGAHLDGVHTLRTLEDAVAIRQRLVPGAPIVVVGAGFIGAEVAASARMLGCEVTILEIAEVPLNRVLGPQVGHIYTQIHRDHGVAVRCGVGLDTITGQHEVTEVIATDGTVHEATAVIIGVGLVPDEEMARDAEIVIGNGVVVDQFCRTSAQDVYAAGDIAFHPNPILGQSFRVEQWQNAQHQGQAAARSMLGIERPYAEIPWFWSDQYDLNLQMAGLPTATDSVVFRGDVDARTFSVFYLRDGVLEGVVGINRVLDVRVGRKLIAQRAVIAPNVLADESTDLASLVAAKVAAT